jgi:hypothetical protein
MGNSASLFFQTADREACLDWRIRPSEDQYDAQQARWNNLAEHLLADLGNRSGYAISSWLQGSYKFGTQIRPAMKGQEFDIDLGVYFNWEGRPQDGELSALKLKDMVQASLTAYASDDANEAQSVSDPKIRCSRIHFDEDFHIDVPAYHLDGGRDVRSLATQDDKWEESDPKAIYTWWRDALDDVARPRARRMVRYLKMWAALNFEDAARPSSIMLTVLVGETYPLLDLTRLSGDDEVFRDLVVLIQNRLSRDSTVSNPVNPDENLNRLPKAANADFYDKETDLALIADRALAAPTRAESAEIWSEAFRHFFPIPEDEEVLEEAAKSLGRSLVSTAFIPEVSVSARTQGVLQRQYTGRNQIGPIPKGCVINFDLANALQLPAGAVVTWTVRNAGEEAELENDLGHFVGEGLSAQEHSAYAGRHYMDVAVKLNGRLMGRRRVPVTITGMALPQRNPPRPSYVKFRGRR